MGRSLRYLAGSLLAAVLLLRPSTARAAEQQELRGPGTGTRALKGALGLGYAFPEESGGKTATDGYGQGVYADFEYVVWPASWFSPRAYSGLVVAPAKAGSCGAGVAPCDVSSAYAFAGAKARLLPPIPWVAPFLEAGLGISLGRFSTQSGQIVGRVTKGVAYHVPFAIGLAMGRQRGFELGLQYLFHPEQKQFSGAWALGVQVELD